MYQCSKAFPNFFFFSQETAWVPVTYGLKLAGKEVTPKHSIALSVTFEIPVSVIILELIPQCCIDYRCTTFALLAHANECVHVHNEKNFPRAKLDSEINVPFLLNEHGVHNILSNLKKN